jgi:hypothetical protein
MDAVARTIFFIGASIFCIPEQWRGSLPVPRELSGGGSGGSYHACIENQSTRSADSSGRFPFEQPIQENSVQSNRARNRKIKDGERTDPMQDAAAANVLAAFEAAQSGGLRPWIATVLLLKLGVAPILTMPPSTRLGRPSVSLSTSRPACGSSKCDGGRDEMRGIDDAIVLERGERTSLRHLATEGRLTLRRSGSYGPDPASKTPRLCGPIYGLGGLGNKRADV